MPVFRTQHNQTQLSEAIKQHETTTSFAVKHLWRILRTFSIGQLRENKLTKPIRSCFSLHRRKKDIQCLSSFSHHAHLFNLRITKWYAWFINIYNLVYCGFIEWVVGQIYEDLFCKHLRDAPKRPLSSDQTDGSAN